MFFNIICNKYFVQIKLVFPDFGLYDLTSMQFCICTGKRRRSRSENHKRIENNSRKASNAHSHKNCGKEKKLKQQRSLYNSTCTQHPPSLAFQTPLYMQICNWKKPKGGLPGHLILAFHLVLKLENHILLFFLQLYLIRGLGWTALPKRETIHHLSPPPHQWVMLLPYVQHVVQNHQLSSG